MVLREEERSSSRVVEIGFVVMRRRDKRRSWEGPLDQRLPARSSRGGLAGALHGRSRGRKINGMSSFAVGCSGCMARNLKSNYAIKPIAEQALGSNRTISCRNGLLRRWISEAVAGCGRAA